MGGSEIGSALFSNGGALGLDVDPSDMRSVLILGGRRGPDAPGESPNVCLLSTSGVVDVVRNSSRGREGRGRDGSASCGLKEEGNLTVVKACAGRGCAVFSGELDSIGGTGGDGFSGENAGALGFNGTLEGKGVVSKGSGPDWGSSRAGFGCGRVNEGSCFIDGGVG